MGGGSKTEKKGGKDEVSTKREGETRRGAHMKKYSNL